MHKQICIILLVFFAPFLFSETDNFNNFLMESSRSFRAGAAVNYTEVSACISAIVELGDSSSYQALFSVVNAGFPEVISYEALGAMDVIPGDLFLFLRNVILSNSYDEKLAAFRAGITSNRLSIYERGQIAELALEQTLNADEDNIDLDTLRYSAVLALTQMRWTRAGPLAIRHYYRVQAEFLRYAVHKERFLEAIAFMGAVGNSQAAFVLGLQLGLINANTERTGYFDAEITKAIIQALGFIGDNAAFDHLLQVSNLSYTEDIQAAAREAIDSLRWRVR